MSENMCVCCGAIIPEGLQVCDNCVRRTVLGCKVFIRPVERARNHWYCGSCGKRINMKTKPRYCCKCGIGIKWEEEEADGRT